MTKWKIRLSSVPTNASVNLPTENGTWGRIESLSSRWQGDLGLRLRLRSKNYTDDGRMMYISMFTNSLAVLKLLFELFNKELLVTWFTIVDPLV